MTLKELAKTRADELWQKMCEWDGISPNQTFVVFSDTNPYRGEFDAAMSYVRAKDGLCLIH
ncbi:MAG: hypothetical protein PHF37_00445 [Phycisphaerae bacterium]|nr:hypothetical protein [Phycisphaerae bacterium]